MTTRAFFYGTLMHPKILQHVIQNDGSHLEICPAVLLGYTRHKVKDAEYPGIIPYSQGRILCDRELDSEEKSVRGSLVTGLTWEDMKRLDHFEGLEYIRKTIDVHPLSSLFKLSEHLTNDEYLVPSKPSALPALTDLAAPIIAETYVYGDFRGLESELWSFEDFVENNAWKWYNV